MQCTKTQRIFVQRIRGLSESLRSSSGLTIVLVPGADGIENKLVDKMAMEQALIHANEITQTEVDATPCIVLPLEERLGYCGTEEMVDDLLQGKEMELVGMDESKRISIKMFSTERRAEGYKCNKVINDRNFFLNKGG